ncbi:hypothetical protein Tco_0901355 [Tanacetum coccineum]
MSDSEDSTVTYTEVSSSFKDLSDIGSPRVDGLPMMLEDPYAYVVDAFQALPSPDYVPGPELRLEVDEGIPKGGPHDYSAGRRRLTFLPRKWLCITPCLRYEVGVSSSAPTTRPTGGFRVDHGFVGTLDDEIRRDPKRYVGYEITDTWDKMVEDMQGTPAATDVVGLNRRAHGRTAKLMETEARLSREAWLQSMDASDTTRFEVRALRTTVLVQQTKIAGLRVADRTRQAQLVETLILLRTLQTQVTKLQSQQGPLASNTTKIPEEAGSVANALAARDADRSQNGEDSHDSGTGTNLKKKMTDKYCPRGEIKKLEAEMWNLKDKESDKIEKYVGGLPDLIHGSVMASKPKTMQDAIEFATELMDKKIRTFAER